MQCIEAYLLISATMKEQAKLRLSCHPFPLHAGEHGILWWVGLDPIFSLQMTTIVIWSTLNVTFTLFFASRCKPSFLDWVLLYSHPLLHPGDLPGILYWVGLDFHLSLHAGGHHGFLYWIRLYLQSFCMKVISLAFWRELDLIIHHPPLLVGDFLGVLKWSKLDFQILFSVCRWPPLRSGLSWTWSSPSCTLRWLP